MDRETLSNFAWILISAMVGIVLITFATPFGIYAMEQTNQIVDNIVYSSLNESENKTPTATIEEDILTIKPLENATSYEVRNGHTLLTTTTQTQIDLSEYIKSKGIHIIKITAIFENGCSDVFSVGYICKG